MTRSRSKSAAAALLISVCQENGYNASELRLVPAIPEIPNGPLVISAGWGRTGTSSLKVQPHLEVGPEIPNAPFVSSAGWCRTGRSSLKVQSHVLQDLLTSTHLCLCIVLPSCIAQSYKCCHTFRHVLLSGHNVALAGVSGKACNPKCTFTPGYAVTALFWLRDARL